MRMPTQIQIYNAKQKNVWDFGNSLLYEMCNSTFTHTQDDQILAKVLFIGRIYAVAIERRRNKQETLGDDFYIDTVAPAFKNSDLDKHLAALKKINQIGLNELKPILETHFYLTSIINKITDLNKRSFSSKYLHFHLPELFFIYDSRAVKGMQYFINRVPGNYVHLTQLNTVDENYAKFYCKCFELKKQIEENYHIVLTNRQFDNLLLNRQD
ncbi:MAG: hypothetical protein AB9888_12380 [Bacteroidales bacterium]